MLKPLTNTERKVLIANRRYAKTKDERHLQRLSMGVELWYLAQDSLVEKGYANWTGQPDFADGRVGEQSDVITPGLISVTALGREALSANTVPKRVGRAMVKATPSVLWLAVSTSLGAAIGSVVTFYVTRLLSDAT